MSFALTLALLVPQGQDELFKVDLGKDPPRVSANRAAVASDTSLKELARAVAWRIEFETRELELDLSRAALDLSFDDQSPRTIAHLIAVASGADVSFDDRGEAAGIVTVLHVIRPPSAVSESGRDRLRRNAATWYQSFLSEDLRHDPLVQEEGIQARMHYGTMLMKQGDLQTAARVFQSIFDENRTHDAVPQALLKLAHCLLEMKQLDAAELWARELSRKNSRLPETAAATVLLGKVLLEKGKTDETRWDECVRVLDASIYQLARSQEIVDLFLLLGEAHRLRGQPGQTLRAMENLRQTKELEQLSARQMADYWFLRGAGAVGVGKFDESMEALEWFLGLADADTRRGMAFVMLGQAYLALGRYLEARAAALEAKAVSHALSKAWRRDARFLEANSALALGDTDTAFEDLEVEVRVAPHEVPEQILFLVGKLIDVGRYEKAVQATKLIDDLANHFGDDARLLRARALFLQAELSGSMKGFPEAALEICKRMTDGEKKRVIAELVGKAWESLGEIDRAADAYRGILK